VLVTNEMKNTIGKNIEFFRKKLNYTKRKIAEVLDVNPSLITYYEQGKRVPSVGKLNKIAEIFEIPVEWLMTENVEDIQLAARTKGKENAAETKEILFFQKIVIDFVELLSKTGMPDYTYKGPQYPYKNPTGSIVKDLKKILGIEDIVYYEQLKQLLQSLFNIYIFEIPFRIEKISGVTFYKDQVFCVFINKGHTQQRRLFSLAHEFGHILFHIHNESYLISRLASTDIVEKEANRFAEMFLISETHLNKLLNKRNLYLFKKEYIQALADFFQVSAESIFYSLAKKGLVQYNWKSYKPTTGYPKDYDKSFSYKDLPWIYVLTCFMAFKQGHITISKFSELIFASIREGSEIINKFEEILVKESKKGNVESSYEES
jgi:Zn-dependent peptidase ImmA (M78 family)/DNA-binding XRE family transcriptional regulator